MVLRRECERSAIGVKFRDEHTAGVSRQFQAAVSSEVVILKNWHRKFSSLSPSLALNTLDLAPVHANGSTCHPPRRRGYQVSHQIGNLLRLSKTSNASLLGKFIDCLSHREIVGRRPTFKKGAPASCHHCPRGYAVDLNSVFNSLFCECLGESVNGRIDSRNSSI